MSRLRSNVAGTLSAVMVAGPLLVGTVVPAVAANSYSATTLYNVCTLHGGRYGYGHLNLNVRGTEHGYSGTDYIRQVAVLQTATGGHWHSGPAARSTSPQLSPASSSNSWTTHWSYQFTSADLPYYHRTRVKVQFWDRRSGPDKLLWTITRYSKSC